jgi:hypothetical protein
MWRKVRLFCLASAFVALSVVVAPRAALADGAAVVGIPPATATNAFGASYTCSGAASASWSGSGYTEITLTGSLSCDGPLVMNGKATLANGPVSVEAAYAPPFATTFASATNYHVAPQGSAFVLQASHTIRARLGYTWTSYPVMCTVTGPFLTCSNAIVIVTN